MKFNKDGDIIVRLERSVPNMVEEPDKPERFEKGKIGVILCGFDEPKESYHVDFFEGDEPYMSDYIGFSLVGPDDISAVEDK